MPDKNDKRKLSFVATLCIISTITIFLAAAGLFIFFMQKMQKGEMPIPSAFQSPDVHADLIRVTRPVPGATITSPLVVEGEARGRWFFEASFPVRLIDENGGQIAITHAEALDDWMTGDFVPFRATVEFEIPASERGFLILEKDNPSGLPENADEIKIPVRFR